MQAVLLVFCVVFFVRITTLVPSSDRTHREESKFENLKALALSQGTLSNGPKVGQPREQGTWPPRNTETPPRNSKSPATVAAAAVIRSKSIIGEPGKLVDTVRRCIS